MKPLSEKILHSETLFEGHFIRLEQATVELPDGKQTQRDIIRHPGAVAILPILDHKVLMVRQYRVAVAQAFWEIPAGKLEPDENLMACAHRELIEETGYRAEKLTELRRFYLTPGFCDEEMFLYQAEGLIEDHSLQQDEDEFLEVNAFGLDEMSNLLDQGHIRDVKTMLALELWKQQSQ